MGPLAAFESVDVAILGSGPCGLGAAWRMASLRLGTERSFVVVDRNIQVGGSASSYTTNEGFTFDVGGHVLYPHEHYSEFIELLEGLGLSWHDSLPIRGVWMDGGLIPYPVQRNLHRLRAWKLIAALIGIISVRFRDVSWPNYRLASTDLESYLRHNFGNGLTNLVLGPLNRKMWAHEPSALGSDWTSQRSGSKSRNVPSVSLRRLLSSLVTRKDQPGWDASSIVRYPASGGTGIIWQSLASKLEDYIVGGEEVVGIDDRGKQIRFGSGRTLHYNRLLSTIPLDRLIALLDHNDDLRPLGAQLRFAQAGLIGFGFSGRPPRSLTAVHSFHTPQGDMPCWRITLPGNLAPKNVPAGDYWSMLCEISSSTSDEVALGAASHAILRGLKRCGILSETSEPISEWKMHVRHGYPVPFLGRDAILSKVSEALMKRDILSRGRFGGWKYEVSNQDHTFMQGVEAIDFLFSNQAETTYRVPATIN